jgi:hypothetical protein
MFPGLAEKRPASVCKIDERNDQEAFMFDWLLDTEDGGSNFM